MAGRNWPEHLCTFAFLCCTLGGCGGWAGYLVYDYFDRSDMLAAEDYRDDHKTTANATVLRAGFEYTGTCAPILGEASGAGTCSAGAEADKLCKNVMSYGGVRYPAPVYGKADTFRRLSKCSFAYVPWYVVEFKVDDQTFKRCAFRFGTFENSEINRDSWLPGSGAWDKTDKFMKSQNKTGSPFMTIWMQDSEDRCVVGVDDLEIFVKQEYQQEGGLVWGAVPMAGFACIALILCFNECAKIGLAPKYMLLFPSKDGSGAE